MLEFPIVPKAQPKETAQDPLSARQIAKFKGEFVDLRLFDTGQVILKFVSSYWTDFVVSPDGSREFLGPPEAILGRVLMNLRTGERREELAGLNEGNYGHNRLSGDVSLFPELEAFLQEVFSLFGKEGTSFSLARKAKFQTTADITLAKSEFSSSLSLRSKSLPFSKGFNLKRARNKAKQCGEFDDHSPLAIVGAFPFAENSLNKSKSLSILVVVPSILRQAQEEKANPVFFSRDISTTAFNVNVFLKDEDDGSIDIHLIPMTYQHLKYRLNSSNFDPVIYPKGVLKIPISQAAVDGLESLLLLPIDKSDCGLDLKYTVGLQTSILTSKIDSSKAAGELKFLLQPAIDIINEESGWINVTDAESLNLAKSEINGFVLQRLVDNKGNSNRSWDISLKAIPVDFFAAIEFIAAIGGRTAICERSFFDLGIKPEDMLLRVLSPRQVRALYPSY